MSTKLLIVGIKAWCCSTTASSIRQSSCPQAGLHKAHPALQVSMTMFRFLREQLAQSCLCFRVPFSEDSLKVVVGVYDGRAMNASLQSAHLEGIKWKVATPDRRKAGADSSMDDNSNDGHNHGCPQACSQLQLRHPYICQVTI